MSRLQKLPYPKTFFKLAFLDVLFNKDTPRGRVLNRLLGRETVEGVGNSISSSVLGDGSSVKDLEQKYEALLKLDLDKLQEEGKITPETSQDIEEAKQILEETISDTPEETIDGDVASVATRDGDGDGYVNDGTPEMQKVSAINEKHAPTGAEMDSILAAKRSKAFSGIDKFIRGEAKARPPVPATVSPRRGGMAPTKGSKSVGSRDYNEPSSVATQGHGVTWFDERFGE